MTDDAGAPPDAASPTAHALRAVSDSVLDDLARLAALETLKRTVRPGDPKLVALAEEVERLAERVLGAAAEQRELTEATNLEATAGAGDAPGGTGAAAEGSGAAAAPSINATPPRAPRLILDAWREAERRAAMAEPRSEEAAALAAEIQRLRAEYRASR